MSTKGLEVLIWKAENMLLFFNVVTFLFSIDADNWVLKS